jgi:hypothetical protein
VTARKTFIAKASFGFAVFSLLLSSCTNGRRHEPVTNTWMDPDASVPVIDIAIAKPRIASQREALLSPAMREAARRILLDEKGYSVVADNLVDSAMTTAGLDATGDPSTAASVVDADSVVFINITKWNTDELIPRGRIYATGSIRAAGRPNGRRVFEHTFQDEILLSPGPVTTQGHDETEKQMAADLINRSLASFRRKT